MRFKRGDIEIQHIIWFILGLIVLVALVYIFRSHITQFLQTLGAISRGINQSVPPVESIVKGG